jgi:hypothetical protein
MDWCIRVEPAELAKQLPRLVAFDSDAGDIRCTAWRNNDKTAYLLDNLRDQSAHVTIHGRKLDLLPGQVVVLPETESEKQREERTAP